MKVDGKEVIDMLGRLQQELPERYSQALEKACLKVEEDGKKNCPVGAGTLRASITHTIEQEDEEIVHYVGSNLDYAHYIHQGTGIYAADGNGRKEVPWNYYDAKSGEWRSTKGIRPTPFLQNAIDENQENIINYFKGVIEDA